MIHKPKSIETESRVVEELVEQKDEDVHKQEIRD